MKHRNRYGRDKLLEAEISAVGRIAVMVEAKRNGWKPGHQMPKEFWRQMIENVEKSKTE